MQTHVRGRFEPLEDRRMLSVFNVDSVLNTVDANVGDGSSAFERSTGHDPTPLTVIGTTPELADTLDPLTSIDVTFSEPIDSGSFDLHDVGLLDMSGAEISPVGTFGGTFNATTVVGSTLYAATFTGLQVFDISTPATPRLLGKYFMPEGDNSAVDVDLVGNFAYVAQGNAGMQVLDVSDPTAITYVGTCDEIYNAYAIDIVDDLAYVAAAHRLFILDISTPSSPAFLGKCDVPGFACDIKVEGDLACIAASSAGVQFVDITDRAAPVLVGGYAASDWALGIDVAGDRAYVAFDRAGLKILGISDPSAPTLIHSYATPSQTYDVAVAGDLAYVVDINGGLEILDVSTPSAPVQLSQHASRGFASEVGVTGDRAYLIHRFYGFEILDIQVPTAPQVLGSYASPGDLRDIIVAGDVAYAIDPFQGLVVVDVSDPATPTPITTCDIQGIPEALVIRENLAYVAVQGKGLYVFDISNPATPTLVGTCDGPNYAKDVEVHDDLAYVLNGSLEIQIIDVSNPASPVVLGACDTPGYARSIHYSESRIYVAANDTGVHVIDVANPAQPTIVGTFDTSGNACEVQAVGNLLFVAEYMSGVRVLDVTNPAQIVSLSVCPVPSHLPSSQITHLQVVGDLVYAFHNEYGLYILDAADPTAMSVLGSLETPGSPKAAHVVGGLVYIADSESGFHVYQVGQSPSSIAHVSGDTYRIDFGQTLPEGDYTLQIGPEIFDATGFLMDQDGDGVIRERSDDMFVDRLTVGPPPLVSLENVVTELPENTDTTERVKVADIVLGDEELGPDALTLSGDDAGLFEIVGEELFVKAATTFDPYGNPQLDVVVSVDDPATGETPDATVSLSITVVDVNDPPTVALENVAVALSEDADTTARTKVADIVITDDALGDETLSLAGANADLFVIAGTELFLKAGASLDFETQPELLVAVEVDDPTVGETPDDTASLTINVTDVNESPSVALQNVAATIPEDADTTQHMKIADIVVSDDALGDETLSLAGDDAERFEIVGTELFLKAGVLLDYETQQRYEVEVRVDDATVGPSPDDAVSLTLDVTDVNESPTMALANIVTTLPEDVATTPAVKIADVVVTDDALGTEVFTLTGDDRELFTIHDGGLYLTSGAVLDFETNPFLDVTVSMDDPTVGETPDDAVSLTVDVTDANDPPVVELQNALATLSEHADTTTRTKVADVVVTDDALGTGTLSLAGDDAWLFELDGNELFLKAGASLDFETNPTLDVAVAVDDPTVGATPDDTASVTIALIDENEAPTIAVANLVTALPETTDTTYRVIVADLVVTDDALGVNTLTLAGDDASLFEIVGTELFLKAGVALDFETLSQLRVMVQVDDPSVGETPDDAASLIVNISDVNEPPSLSLLNIVTDLLENTDTAQRIKIADILATDDSLGTNAFSLSGADAASFEIVGEELFLKAGVSLDYEAQCQYDVVVTIDDPALGAGPEDAELLTLEVADLNEAPSMEVTQLVTALSEDTDTSLRICIAEIAVIDDALGTETLTLAGDDADLFEIVGATLYMKAGASLDFETNPTLDLTVVVDDPTVGQTPDATHVLAVAVTDVNDPPTLVLENTITTLSEHADTSARLKVADIAVNDDALGTSLIALAGADAGCFEIVENALYLKSGVILDYEAQSQYDIIVEVDDPTVGATPDDAAAYTLEVGDVEEFDYGDAPDLGPGVGVGDYQTLASDDGPRHTIVAGLYLGAGVDHDDGTLQNASADADDISRALPKDEDGVIHPAADLTLTVGVSPRIHLLVNNDSNVDAHLYGWIDYNQDGVFDDATERADVEVPAGTLGGMATLVFPSVQRECVGRTYVRFRLSTDEAAAHSTGPASDGEVEDYPVTIMTSALAQPSQVTEISGDAGSGPLLADYGRFGSSVVSLGDLDGDGVTDLAVGADLADDSVSNGGAVHILMMESDGTVRESRAITSADLGTLSLSTGDFFGASLASLGDLDGDGVVDLAVGATGDDAAGDNNGAVYVLRLNADGTVKAAQRISPADLGDAAWQGGQYFGCSVASLGDLNLDGVPDLAVGAYGDSGSGAVYILFMDYDGTVAGSRKVGDLLGGGPNLSNSDQFGTALASLGDLDGDGITELAVGAPGDDSGGSSAGAVYVLMMQTDGAAKSATKIGEGVNGGPSLDGSDRFGVALAAISDLDGDGVADLAVGASGDDAGGANRGAVHVLFMNADGSSRETAVLDDGNLGQGTLADGDRFGASVASLNDFNGDGVVDLAIGANYASGGGSRRGVVHLVSLQPLVSDANVTALVRTDDMPNAGFTDPAPAWIDEWTPLWIDVWATHDSSVANSFTVNSFSVDLRIDPSVHTVVFDQIQPGIGFELGSPDFDAETGVLHLSGAAADSEQVGEHVLLARVRLQPNSGVPVVSTDGDYPQPVGMTCELTAGTLSHAGVGEMPAQVATSAVTDLYAVPFDMNDDGAVGRLDYLAFRNHFGRTVTGASNDLTTPVLDFNQDGEVERLDYLLFRNNYGKNASSGGVMYAANYPFKQSEAPSFSTTAAFEAIPQSNSDQGADTSLAGGEQTQERYLMFDPAFIASADAEEDRTHEEDSEVAVLDLLFSDYDAWN